MADLLIPDGKSLYGDGTINDTIENDVWIDGERKCRITRYWEKLECNGQESWKRIEKTDNGADYWFLNLAKNITLYDSKKPSLCSHLVYNNSIASDT